MSGLKTVGIKDLKNNLSAYLREVRRGARILVSDRSTIVAELHEPGAAYPLPDSGDPVMAEWIDAGIVSPPAREKKNLAVSPVSAPEGTSTQLLDEDRTDGRS